LGGKNIINHPPPPKKMREKGEKERIKGEKKKRGGKREFSQGWGAKVWIYNQLFTQALL